MYSDDVELLSIFTKYYIANRYVGTEYFKIYTANLLRSLKVMNSNDVIDIQLFSLEFSYPFITVDDKTQIKEIDEIYLSYIKKNYIDPYLIELKDNNMLVQKTDKFEYKYAEIEKTRIEKRAKDIADERKILEKLIKSRAPQQLNTQPRLQYISSGDMVATRRTHQTSWYK